jgi:hypothetical protein
MKKCTNRILSLAITPIIMYMAAYTCSGQTMTADSAVGDQGTGSSSSHSTPASTHASSGSHSSNGGSGGGGDPAADLSNAMHEKLAADTAARDQELSGLSAAGATAQSQLDTVFNNAISPSSENAPSSVVAAELIGSGQSPTSESDFAMPTPEPNAGLPTVAQPEAAETPSVPSMPLAAYDPTYADQLPLKAGTNPYAPQIGAAPLNVQVTGVDDPSASPDAQAAKFLVGPQIDSYKALYGVAGPALEEGAVGVIKDAIVGQIKDAVMDKVKEVVSSQLCSSPQNSSYCATATPTPSPQP